MVAAKYHQERSGPTSWPLPFRSFFLLLIIITTMFESCCCQIAAASWTHKVGCCISPPSGGTCNVLVQRDFSFMEGCDQRNVVLVLDFKNPSSKFMIRNSRFSRVWLNNTVHTGLQLEIAASNITSIGLHNVTLHSSTIRVTNSQLSSALALDIAAGSDVTCNFAVLSSNLTDTSIVVSSTTALAIGLHTSSGFYLQRDSIFSNSTLLLNQVAFSGIGPSGNATAFSIQRSTGMGGSSLQIADFNATLSGGNNATGFNVERSTLDQFAITVDGMIIRANTSSNVLRTGSAGFFAAHDSTTITGRSRFAFVNVDVAAAATALSTSTFGFKVAHNTAIRPSSGDSTGDSLSLNFTGRLVLKCTKDGGLADGAIMFHFREGVTLENMKLDATGSTFDGEEATTSSNWTAHSASADPDANIITFSGVVASNVSMRLNDFNAVVETRGSTSNGYSSAVQLAEDASSLEDVDIAFNNVHVEIGDRGHFAYLFRPVNNPTLKNVRMSWNGGSAVLKANDEDLDCIFKVVATTRSISWNGVAFLFTDAHTLTCNAVSGRGRLLHIEKPSTAPFNNTVVSFSKSVMNFNVPSDSSYIVSINAPTTLFNFTFDQSTFAGVCNGRAFRFFQFSSEAAPTATSISIINSAFSMRSSVAAIYFFLPLCPSIPGDLAFKFLRSTVDLTTTNAVILVYMYKNAVKGRLSISAHESNIKMRSSSQHSMLSIVNSYTNVVFHQKFHFEAVGSDFHIQTGYLAFFIVLQNSLTLLDGANLTIANSRIELDGLQSWFVPVKTKVVSTTSLSILPTPT